MLDVYKVLLTAIFTEFPFLFPLCDVYPPYAWQGNCLISSLPKVIRKMYTPANIILPGKLKGAGLSV